MRYIFLLCLTAATSLAQPVTETQKLTSLCKVWGFLKYYHPTVASGKQDWDRRLIQLLPVVHQAGDKQQLNAIFTRLIDSLGTVRRCRSCQPETPPTLGRQKLDVSFLTDSLLFTEDVRSRLTYLKNNRHLGNNYYVRQDKWIRNASFENEKSYADMVIPDESYRLLALFRYWNIIHYFFPYKYAIEGNWDEVLSRLIPIFQQANTSETYQKALYQLVASIKDSHGFLTSTDKSRCLRCDLGTLWLPFELTFINDKAVVTRIYNDSLINSSALAVGTVISAIDGQSIRSHIDRLRPYVSASNEAVVQRDVNKLIGVGANRQARLTIDQPGGRDTTIVVSRYMYKEFGKRASKSLNSRYPLSKWLSDSIGYVNMGHLTQRQIDSVMKPLLTARTIIFDLRNYPQGTLLLVGWYLTDKRSTFARFTRPNLSFPGVFEQIGSSTLPPAKGKPYAGNVIVLVNEDTQSQAEFTAMAFQTLDRVTLVGSTTAGADGNISWVPLPGGYRTAFSGIGVFYPDGRETQRIGIVPDIVVQPTLKGIRAGRDEVLERAVEISRGN